MAFPMMQPDFSSPLSPQSGAIPSVLQTASQPVKGTGMFGGNTLSILAAALAGATSRQTPDVLNNIMAGQLQRQRLRDEEAQYQQHRQSTLADQMALLNYKQILDPTNGMDDFDKTLVQAGLTPGSPEWLAAHVTRKDNMLDPVVMTAQGPMLRSQLVAKPLTDDDIARMSGGQTQPASGTFQY
jgi:hypothetical protein